MQAGRDRDETRERTKPRARGGRQWQEGHSRPTNLERDSSGAQGPHRQARLGELATGALGRMMLV